MILSWRRLGKVGGCRIYNKITEVNYILGGIPEWPKGADCNSVSYAFEGSNPSSPILVSDKS